MQATGARINEDKSRAIALGSWTKTTPIMTSNTRRHKNPWLQNDGEYKRISKKIWAILTSKIRTHKQNAYH